MEREFRQREQNSEYKVPESGLASLGWQQAREPGVKGGAGGQRRQEGHRAM